MAQPRLAQPVKLICGLISADREVIQRGRQLLTRRFGPIDLESDTLPFDQTSYYADEMGPGLLRVFVSFLGMVSPESLAMTKHETNALERYVAEERAALGVERPLNLDPGYVDVNKLVLASAKDAPHRLPLGARIHGEVTLSYTREGWREWPWTYLSYRTPEAQVFFTRVRARLLEQRNQAPPESPEQPEDAAEPPEHKIKPPDDGETYDISDADVEPLDGDER